MEPSTALNILNSTTDILRRQHNGSTYDVERHFAIKKLECLKYFYVIKCHLEFQCNVLLT